jgi:hypothetical protein
MLNDINLLEALGFIDFRWGFLSPPHHIISLCPLWVTPAHGSTFTVSLLRFIAVGEPRILWLL